MRIGIFNIAKRLSYKSDYESHKLGAVVARGKRIEGIGFNRRRSHPKSNTRYCNTHAELSAILNCHKDDLSGCEIYVYRETKSKELAIAKPCQFCHELIKKVGIKRVHYTVDGGYASYEI